MNASAWAWSALSMASVSVERRGITDVGSIRMGFLGGRLPRIKRSSNAAA